MDGIDGRMGGWYGQSSLESNCEISMLLNNSSFWTRPYVRTKPIWKLCSCTTLVISYTTCRKEAWCKRRGLAAMSDTATKKQIIAESIRGIPNFPKPGILFWDITTLLLSPTAFQYTLDLLVERYQSRDLDGIAALESRGFVFGAPLAAALKLPLILLRKPKKLPGETISQSYDLEYGSDTIEMHSDAVKQGQKILVVDDLMATGGTMTAAVHLLEKAKANVVEVAVVIELPDLKGREKLGKTPIFVLIEKEGL